MADGVQIPVVGKLPQKQLLIGAGVAAAAFVGWKYWQSRQTDTASPIADGEFGAVDTSIPGVVGAVSPTNSYGSTTGTSTDTGDDGRNLTTNAAWTAYARSQLSGSYDDAEVLAALGNFLGSRPLSTGQQTIVRAAVAVAGYPPVGTFAIIPGGDTGISIAPAGLRAITIRPDHVTLGWGSVAGASSYRLYGGGQSTTVNALQGTISALAPGTSYTFYVVALNGAGTEGPRSSSVTVKTAAASSSAPGAVNPIGYGWQQVHQGDSLASFAKRAGITTSALRTLNAASALNRLTPGEWLKTRSTANPTSGYKG